MCIWNSGFTTPAVWSDQIRFEYKEAAIRAGFGPSDDRPDDTICMLCEAEAAALATFETMPLCGRGMQTKVRGLIFNAKGLWLTLTI
jgi:hypothetical protein